MRTLLLLVLLAAPAYGQIALDWNICPDATAGYRVYRSDRVLPLATVVISDYLDAAVTPGQVYTYTVAILTAAGEGAKSAPFTAKAPDVVVDVVPPAPIGICAANQLVVTGLKWPSKSTGGRSLTWNSGTRPIVSVIFTAPGTALFTDDRGCTFTATKP